MLYEKKVRELKIKIIKSCHICINNNVLLVKKTRRITSTILLVDLIDVGHNLIFNFCNDLILIFLCKKCYFKKIVTDVAEV